MSNFTSPSTQRSPPPRAATITAQLIQPPLPGLGETRCQVTTLWAPVSHPPDISPPAPTEEPANA